MRKSLLLVVMLFVVVMAVALPAQASWEPFVSLSLSKDTDRVVAASAPQAALKWGPSMVRQWSEAMGEYLKGLPIGSNLGDGLELIIYPNVNAGGNQVLGVYYAMAELRGNVRFGKDPFYMPDPACGLHRANLNEATGRWSVNIMVSDHRGPQCLYFYALVRDAVTNRYRILFFSWSSKHNASQVVSKVEWTTSIWTRPMPNFPWELAKAMDANGVGGDTYWPDAYNEPPVAPTAPATQPISRAPARYVDPDAAERAHEELATGVTVNAENIQRLGVGHDSQQGEINALKTEVRQLQGWMNSTQVVNVQAPVPAVAQTTIIFRNVTQTTVERRFWFVTKAPGPWRPCSTVILRLAPGQTLKWPVSAETVKSCAGWDMFAPGRDPNAEELTVARYSFVSQTVEVR